MEGHQRNLYLYERFNAQVVGVSRDDVTTLQYFSKDLGLQFPLLSNTSAFLGESFAVQAIGSPVFNRRTAIVDRKGIIRYLKDGSPNFKDILLFLKKLNQEGVQP